MQHGDRCILANITDCKASSLQLRFSGTTEVSVKEAPNEKAESTSCS
jgi:hypothetical protein